MADSENTSVKEDPAEEQAVTDEAAAVSDAPVEGATAEEAPTEVGGEQAPPEEEAEKAPEAEAEPTAEASAEGGEEQKAESVDEGAKPVDEDAGEGEKPVEGEQQAEASEQPAESSEQGAVEGVEKVDGVESSDVVEDGEAADRPAAQAVDGAEPVEPTEGGEQAEQIEGGELAEAGEPVEGGEATETGEAAEAGEPTEEASEKPEKTEGEEAGEEGEKKEEGDEEPKGGEEEEQVDGGPAQEEAEESSEPRPEGAESPVGVGEKLSRDPTPDMDKDTHQEQERIEATTPEKLEELPEGSEDGEQHTVGEEEEMVEEEQVMEEPQFRRDELIEKYHDALTEREQLQQQNYSLQHKLAEYFRKKKADERQDYDKNVTDQEQRYLKYMAQLEDLRRQDSMEKENFRAQIEDAKDRCQEKKEKVDIDRKKFMEFKKQVALNAINSRSGKPIPPKDIEQYMVNEVKKEQEVVNVRLENIKLKNKLKKKEQQLKSKEELAEGLHLIDFEQLKIENQTYNEKIEERNEELLKLRKKITGTVQVLTHLKEKLQFVQGENLEQNNQLKEVEATLAQSRDILSRTKQARDALRIDNQRLRQNCGLLGNEALLRDFEERKDEADDLRSKLEQLRMKHAELTLHCNQVRRKIDQARQSVA